MAETFAERLVKWQGKRSNVQAAGALGIPLATYRKYKYGSRTPGAAHSSAWTKTLAMAELERRMNGQPEVVTK